MASRPRRCQCDGCKNSPLDDSPFCNYHKQNGCSIVSPLSGSEPVYNPEEWTTDKAIQHSHNCYAYALNVKDKKKIESCRLENKCRFHSPGKKAGHSDLSKSDDMHCAIILSRTMSDIPGATPTDFASRCPVGTSKIAVVTDETQDMHYYRQGKSGYWDHKPGGREPTDKDSAGVAIYNPQLASRYYPREHKDDDPLNYKNFCGYLCVPRTKPIQLKGGLRFGISRKKIHKKTHKRAHKKSKMTTSSSSRRRRSS